MVVEMTSITVADNTAGGTMDPIRICVNRIHSDPKKTVFQAFAAEHGFNPSRRRIVIIRSGLVNLKSLKRPSAGTGFQSAFCGFLLLALLAQPIRTLSVEPVGSPLPVGRAETPAANHATDKANYKIKSTFRKDFTQDDIKLIQDIISILLLTAGFYAGVTIPQIYWKVKLYRDKKKRKERRFGQMIGRNGRMVMKNNMKEIDI